MNEDATALERVAGGDRDAFERFVRRHEGAVYRYIRTRTAGADEAEDALQETFIAAWRSAGTFRGTGSARAWLLAIARNAVHRQFRRPVGAPERFETLDSIAVRAGWGRDPDEALHDRISAREVVERAFRALSADDREILVLRDLEGFSNDDVADMLELGLAAVKSRLHRARLRFIESVRGSE